MTITASTPSASAAAIAVPPALVVAIAVSAPCSAAGSAPGFTIATTAVELETAYRTSLAGLRAVSTTVADYRSLDDAALLALNASAAEQVTLAHTHQALIAGEVARRSAPELGSQGLAQRTGHRTPEQFIRHTTGSTGRDAVTAVKAGRLLAETADGGTVDQVTGELLAPTQPWLAPVATALTAGILSPAAADAIGSGLGEPNTAINTDQLTHAAIALIGQAVAGMHVDALHREARMVRSELDVAGIAIAEVERFARRDLKLFDGADGAGKLVWAMDPETYVLAKQIFHRVTSPKLGTVRFVQPDESTRATAIASDDRTVGQLASDSFLQLLRLGSDSNPQLMLGTGAPIIRVTTTAATLHTSTSGSTSTTGSRTGIVRMEGATDPVSTSTLDRLRCEGEIVSVVFDQHGIAIDLGREQRLYNRHQREILSVKWGGCADPDCDRPPSWCEAHHIEQWKRDHGKTDIADGILLCKHHHLLYHNNNWNISRDSNGNYWLTKPPDIDPSQTPVLLKQSRAMDDLARERDARP